MAVVIVYLGCGVAQSTAERSSGLAAAVPPSWRCTEERGVSRRGCGGVRSCRGSGALYIAKLGSMVDMVRGGVAGAR